jgi:hypothetical protein
MRVGTLKLVEVDEDYHQDRDFSPHGYGWGSACDGVHAAIKRHDSAGEVLLPAYGPPMWRSHHAVFALLLQDGRFAGAGCGGKIVIHPDASTRFCLRDAAHRCFWGHDASRGCSLLCPWPFPA